MRWLMRIASTIEAIRKFCPIFENRVFGAAAWANLPTVIAPEKLPACYVFVLNESPNETQRSENSYYQEISTTIAVVIVVDATLDNRGQTAIDIFEDCKEQLFKALLNWSPIETDNFAVYEYSAFNLLSLNKAYLAAQCEFTCNYVITFEDTRGPIENEKLGRFERMDLDIDVINPNKPDGQIEVKAKIKDLW